MTTSHTMHVLSKPEGRQKIPEGTLSYLKTRNRLKAFDYIWRELDKSGLSKSELADRLGKGQDRISHLLGAPGNWTLDTLSELAFAVCAATVEYKSSFPLDKPPKNQTRPVWLYDHNRENISFQFSPYNENPLKLSTGQNSPKEKTISVEL